MSYLLMTMMMHTHPASHCDYRINWVKVILVMVGILLWLMIGGAIGLIWWLNCTG